MGRPRRAHRVGAAGALLALVAAFAFACGQDETPARDARDLPPPATVEQAYQRMRDAMDSGILHSVVTATISDDEGERPEHTREYWIDAETGMARMQYTLDPSVDSYDRATSETAIVEGLYIFTPDDEDEALRREMDDRCDGSDEVLVAFLLYCNSDWDSYTFAAPRLEIVATYEGEPALAVVTEASAENERVVVTTFMDPATLLPRAKVIESSFGGASRAIIAEYRHEFVGAASLDSDFLDPRSIGYGPPASSDETLDERGADASVYWVGEEFTASGGEEFVLVRLPDPLYGNSTHLVYETPEGLDTMDILIWTKDGWDAFLQSDMGQRLSNVECVPQTDLLAENAVVYTVPWPEFPVSEAPQTREEVCDLVVAKEPELVRWGHLAVVEFDDAVVAVGEGNHNTPADLTFIAHAVRGLERREP